MSQNGSECSSQTILYTSKRLSSVVFDDQDITKIIRALNINKAHGHDDISIRMIKICDSALAKPLSQSYLTIVEKMVPFHIYVKNPIINNYQKMSQNKSLITIDLFHYYQYLVKFLKG